MTTITRETLELTALAAGIEIEWHDDIGLCWAQPADSYAPRAVWRPHTDIAAAARLAISLKADVAVDDDDAMATTYISKISETVLIAHDGTKPGRERAYCEAITLCAAGIGRRMRGGGR